MTIKDQIHQLVDRLTEDRLRFVLPILEDLEAEGGPLYTFDNAPPEDEEITAEEAAAVEAAKQDPRPPLTTEEVCRQLGIPLP